MNAMRRKDFFRTGSAMVAVAVVLLAGHAAQAECLPGQMQEADLAYQNARESLELKSWDQALSRMQSIVEFCPEHVEATRGIGEAYMGKEEFDLAVTYFQKVIVLRGVEVQAPDFANLASAYARLKKFKEARAEYMKAEQLSPDDCGVLFNLGVLHDASGFSDKAVDVFERLLNTDECERVRANAMVQVAKAAGRAAEQQKRSGNITRAQHYTELAQQYGGQVVGSATMDLVRQHLKAGDPNAAVLLLKAELDKDPERPNAWLTLARAQDQAGDRSASADAYRKYLEMKPTDTTEWGAMLRVMAENGQCAEAAAQAARAFDEHRSRGREAVAPILYSWGLALECQKEFASARAKFQQCAESGSKRYSDSARQKVERMDGLKAVDEADQRKANQGR